MTDLLISLFHYDSVRFYMIYKKCWYFKPPPKEMLLYITYQNKSDIRCNLILCKCWLLKLVIFVLLSYRTMTVNPRYVELWFLQCRLSDRSIWRSRGGRVRLMERLWVIGVSILCQNHVIYTFKEMNRQHLLITHTNYN